MPDCDVLFIGAGHNALVCAGYLAKAGYKVILLERRHKVGGAVVTEEIVPGFKFDLGGSAHILIHHTPIIQDLNLAAYGLEYIDLDPLFFTPFPDGSHFFIWKDLDRTCESIAQISPQDADNYRKFITTWEPLAKGMVASFLEPPTGQNLFKNLILKTSSGSERFERLSDILRGYGQVLRQSFVDPRVQAAIAWMAAQSGPPPGEPMSAPFALWQPMYHHSGMKRPRGGSGMLTQALASMIQAHGGMLIAGAPVTRIITRGGQAVGAETAGGMCLRDWLRTRFFADVHRQLYEDRPIHWPLSSSRKTFVAWVSIHRLDASTLTVLLADHLLDPTLKRLEGELDDLRAIRDGTDKKAAREAERRFDKVLRWRDELQEFIAAVEQCAERGPPPPDAKCRPREVDARYDPDLDDGVMVNSAALWPLLDPQWSKPKKWWKELAAGEHDWPHLAMRYWPKRVEEACQTDPSFGVAHGCFWKYHPDRAWRWELRLQDEIGPDFRIEEGPYRGDGGHEAHRAKWLETAPDEALAAVEKEARDRRRRHKQPQVALSLLETGFWYRHPLACWELELRVSEAQGAEFRILAPDEPAGRTKFEAENPGLVAERAELLSRLAPAPDLFDGENDASQDDADAEDDDE